MARNPMAGGRSGAGGTRRGLSFRFISESYQELRRVTWPTREETMRLTLMVIAVAAAIGAFLSIVDILFSRLINTILG
jgi:preprotein translocase subunit SecE